MASNMHSSSWHVSARGSWGEPSLGQSTPNRWSMCLKVDSQTWMQNGCWRGSATELDWLGSKYRI